MKNSAKSRQLGKLPIPNSASEVKKFFDKVEMSKLPEEIKVEVKEIEKNTNKFTDFKGNGGALYLENAKALSEIILDAYPTTIKVEPPKTDAKTPAKSVKKEDCDCKEEKKSANKRSDAPKGSASKNNAAKSDKSSDKKVSTANSASAKKETTKRTSSATKESKASEKDIKDESEARKEIAMLKRERSSIVDAIKLDYELFKKVSATIQKHLALNTNATGLGKLADPLKAELKAQRLEVAILKRILSFNKRRMNKMIESVEKVLKPYEYKSFQKSMAKVEDLRGQAKGLSGLPDWAMKAMNTKTTTRRSSSAKK